LGVVSADGDWRSQLRHPTDAVVIAGGDGTVRDVFKELAGSRTPAAVLPLGTANNVARSLGVSPEVDVNSLAAGWDLDTLRRYDLLAVHTSRGDSWAVESVGGGLFAEVIRRGSEPPSHDKLRHGLETLQATLQDMKTVRWRVNLDGTPLDGDYLAVEALIVGAIGPAVQLAIAADPSDRMLDAVLIRPEHRRQLIDYTTARLVDQGSADSLTLPTHRGRVLNARPEHPIHAHIDDELIEDVEEIVIRVSDESLEVFASASDS
jgi:diacylglycerol kinase (ATP)